MNSRRRKVIIFICLVIAGVGITFCWQLWLIDGMFHPIQWSIEEGGLTLSYIPGKGPLSNYLYVEARYIRGSQRTWVMTYPGSTNRIIGAPTVPPPEDLFASARIPLGESDPIGLCNFYDDASENQRLQIVGNLQYDTEKSSEVRHKLQQLLDAGNHPWLIKVLDE